MRNLMMTTALALSFALPITAISTTATADPHYWVQKDSRPGSDGKVYIMSHAGGGRVKCIIPADNFLDRNHEQNWSRFIHVEWKFHSFLSRDHQHGPDPRENSQEWNFKDARGKWCPIWDRRGWVDKADPDLKVLFGHPQDGRIWVVPDTWSSTVHTTGIWGDSVPVFRDSGAFFNARNEMNKHGHYNSQKRNVKCLLNTGTRVSFTPHKDWGTGEVWMLPTSPANLRNCSGWIDRGVIR